MTYRLACERPDKIAAIAPVGGGLADRLMRLCAAASRRPIPLLVMRGTADEVNRFDDGELEGNVQYWIRRNGCTLSPVVTRLPDLDPDDGTRTRVESYENCQDGANVTLYAIEGCGHHWPGGDEPWRFGNGQECRDFDAGVHI
jgi:polyhydroxybutyrate depolymerase